MFPYYLFIVSSFVVDTLVAQSFNHRISRAYSEFVDPLLKCDNFRDSEGNEFED